MVTDSRAVRRSLRRRSAICKRLAVTLRRFGTKCFTKERPLPLTTCDTCPVAIRSGMGKDGVLDFLRRHRLCVQASVADVGAPQAAVVGYAVTDELEIVFDTLASTRKLQNLRQDPRIALVVGWDAEQTLQIEGLADEPSGETLTRLKRRYFEAFPDGIERERWPGICYVRVRAHWVRFSDFRDGSVFELDKEALSALRVAQL